MPFSGSALFRLMPIAGSALLRLMPFAGSALLKLEHACTIQANPSVFSYKHLLANNGTVKASNCTIDKKKQVGEVCVGADA